MIVRTILPFFLLAASAAAQFTTASLSGTVLDTSAATLPDARVTVRNVDTGFSQNAVTDATGAFLSPLTRRHL